MPHSIQSPLSYIEFANMFARRRKELTDLPVNARTLADQQELQNIKSAFDRINSKSFGFCESCDERISAGRLRARPFVRICTFCQSEQEKAKTRNRPSPVA